MGDKNSVPPVITAPIRIPYEKESEARLDRKVKRAGGFTWKFKSPNQRGVCDRIVIFCGRVIFVEMKREGKDILPGSNQEAFRDRVIRHGGEHAVVAGHDGVDEFIERIKADRNWFTQGMSFLFALGIRMSDKFGK